MSCADLDLDDFTDNHPCTARGFVIFLLVYTLVQGMASHPTLFPCALPMLYALACGKRMQKRREFTSAGVAFMVLAHFGDGVAAFDQGAYIAGCIHVAGTGMMCGLWWWVKRIRGIGNTDAFWLLLHTALATLGLAGLAVLLDLAIATAGAIVHLAIAGFLPLAFLPPLVFAHRHFLFTLMSRRFEGKQRLQDGGFMAALLDIINHQAGDPYWIHLSDAHKDKMYNTNGSTLMSPL